MMRNVMKCCENCAGRKERNARNVVRAKSTNAVFIRGKHIVGATFAGHTSNSLMDLTDTVFEGHHQPLRVWILCLYLMGLNLSAVKLYYLR